ncbi:MAG: extracellular solute-binding protein [Clostridia bacterium]|nr:extracellular solute-binding protein [Clostridia bacterium]
MKKKSLLFKILLGSLIILFVVPHSVGAAVIGEWVKALVAKDYTILWDGEEYIPENPDGSPVYPIVYNGRTYLPLRNIAEKTGLDVNWDSSTNTIEIGKKKEDENKKDAIRVVTYMTGADAFTGAYKTGIEGFEQKNPGVNVIDDSVPAPNDMFKTKINTDFAAGNEPDVCFAFTGVDANPLFESGKLLSWDEEIKKDPDWSNNFYKPSFETTRWWDGKIYALPYIGYFEGVYYNKDLFKKHNVKVPTNWNELHTAVNTFKSKGIVPISVSFAEEPHYLIETFILSLGGKEGHEKPFDASWAPALNYIKLLYEKGAFSKDALTIKAAAANQLFFDEKAAMMINGSWFQGGLRESMQNKVGIMPLPMLPNGKADPTDIIAGFGSGWYVSEPKNTKKDGIPVKFVKHMTTPDMMQLFIDVGGVPAIKCETSQYLSTRKEGIAMHEKAKNACVPVDTYIKPQAFKKIWKGLSYIVTGKTTAEQILKEAKALNED